MRFGLCKTDVFLTIAVFLSAGLLLTGCSTQPAFTPTDATDHVQASAAATLTEGTGTAADPVSVVTPQSTEMSKGADEGAGCRKIAGTDVPKSRRYVNVNVATLWRTPHTFRSLDEPSLRAPVDIPAWLGPMSIRDKLWLVGRIETEALYGQPVELLEKKGEWVRIAVIGQTTPISPSGYPGWLPARQLSEHSAASDYTGCPVAVVRTATTWLYEDEQLQRPRLQLSFNTRLPVADTRGSALLVATPEDGLLWLPAGDADVRKANQEAERPTGTALVTLGKQFLGLPYLWAGTSGFGFDCSGFTYSLYRFYGIELPQDAKDQANAGKAVDRSALQPGDLLFFAYAHGKGAVHHVAMYAGGGMMLHSPRTERTVELIPLSTPEYAAEFAGARRVLN